MAVQPAKLTTARAAIYILSWLFIFQEWFKMESRIIEYNQTPTDDAAPGISVFKPHVPFAGGHDLRILMQKQIIFFLSLLQSQRTL